MNRRTNIWLIAILMFTDLPCCLGQSSTIYGGDLAIPAVYCFYCDLGNCPDNGIYNSGIALRNQQHTWIQILNNSEIDLIGETSTPNNTNYVRLYLFGSNGEPIVVDTHDCDGYFENSIRDDHGVYLDVTRYFPSVLNQTTYPSGTPTPTPTPGFPRFSPGQTASFYLPPCLNSIDDRSLPGYNPPTHAILKIKRTFSSNEQPPEDGIIEVLIDAGWELLYNQKINVPAFTPVPTPGNPTPTPVSTVIVNHSGQDAGSLLNRSEFNIRELK